MSNRVGTEAPTALTVMEAISRPAFRGAVVVGGWSGLKKPVSAVTVAEVPDSAQWLAGGELVLTTAYMVRSDPEGFVNWLRSLAEYGAAGLAVKPQRFLGTLPADVMREADRLGLPLIALPYAVNWPNLIKPVTEAILLRSGGLQRVTHLDQFTALLEEQKGFASVCQALAGLCGCTAVLTDLHGRILGFGEPGRDGPGSADPDGTAQTGDHSASDDTAATDRPAPGGGRPALGSEAATEPTAPLHPAVVAYLRGGSGLPDWQQSPSHNGTEAWQQQLEGGVAVRSYPLQVQASIRGMLTLLVTSLPLTEPTLAIADAWAAALALTYERLATRHESPAGERSTDLRRLLRKQATNLPGADHPLTRALSTPGFVAAVGLSGEDALGAVTLMPTGAGGELVPEDRLVTLIDDWLRSRDALAAVTVIDGRPAVIAHAADAEAWAEGLYGFLKERSSTKQVCLAIGGPASDLTTYRRSLEQALGLLRLMEHEGRNDGVWLYSQLGIRRLLADLGDLSRARPFAAEVLGPLLKADPALHLLETLRSYLELDGRIPATAKALYIHPNTVRYRLRRIEALTGLDLNSIDHQAQLWLALHVYDLTHI